MQLETGADPQWAEKAKRVSALDKPRRHSRQKFQPKE
jgi:hypothetical protein